MKRIISTLALIISVLFGLQAFGQQTSSYKPFTTAYTVQRGDTLWELSGERLNDPYLWQQVVKKNPFLLNDQRIFERNGQIVVLIKPGEKLEGLAEFGLVPNPLPLSSLTVASKPALKSVQVFPETTNTTSIPWVLIALVTVAFFLVYLGARWHSLRQTRQIALERNPLHPVFQAEGMRSQVLDLVGIPVSSTEEMRASNAALSRVNEVRASYGQERLGGKLAEIIETTITLPGEVLTQYRYSTLASAPNGHRIFLGIFRNDRGAITFISFNVRACLNGMLFEEMSETEVRTFATTVRFQSPKRVWNSTAYARPLNMAEIQAWINRNLAIVASREATTTPTIQSEEAPVSTTEESVISESPVSQVTETGLVPTGASAILMVGGRQVEIIGSAEITTHRDGNITIITQPGSLAPVANISDRSRH